jgi:hypothetical protein
MMENTTFEMKEFIGVFENAITDRHCEELIDAFKTSKEMGQTRMRQEYDDSLITGKDDESMTLAEPNSELSKITFQNQAGFLEYMNDEIVEAYVKHHPILAENPRCVFEGKVQRTLPGQGYHIWHCEQNGTKTHDRDRFLAWSVFLNDVEEGGETEFLHQHLRFKPKAGTALVFPAYFTHLHRGNPPLSGEKYIATGWVEYF